MSKICNNLICSRPYEEETNTLQKEYGICIDCSVRLAINIEDWLNFTGNKKDQSLVEKGDQE